MQCQVDSEFDLFGDRDADALAARPRREMLMILLILVRVGRRPTKFDLHSLIFTAKILSVSLYVPHSRFQASSP